MPTSRKPTSGGGRRHKGQGSRTPKKKGSTLEIPESNVNPILTEEDFVHQFAEHWVSSFASTLAHLLHLFDRPKEKENKRRIKSKKSFVDEVEEAPLDPGVLTVDATPAPEEIHRMILQGIFPDKFAVGQGRGGGGGLSGGGGLGGGRHVLGGASAPNL